MLYVTFREPKDFNRDVDVYFNNRYDTEWLKDPLVKQMIKDVDSSELVDGGVVISPVLGAIPITKISGGVKALILMLKTDKIIWGTACGDNCSDWIVKISKMKDVTLFYEHPMRFNQDFDGVCIDTGKEIKSDGDFMDCYLEDRGYFD
jgi:hypothetical protein